MPKDERKLKILITGGAGFIGSHLADKLLDTGLKVTVLDNLKSGSLENLKSALRRPNFRFIKGDVLKPKDCLKAAKNSDIVYHLACLGVRHSIYKPLENHLVNAQGTLNVLEACRKNRVKKFFYISSSEVYGAVKKFPIKEDAAPFPLTVYGASKLAGEHYTNVYGKIYGLNSTVFRIFNNYGPRAHYEGDKGELIPRAIVSILYNRQPVLCGDGNNTRDFLYVKDTARALSNFIDTPDLNGITINIATGTETKIKDAAGKILVLMGKEHLGLKFLESRPADVPRLWADTGKFRGFNFRPEYSFEDGLLETIDYYRQLSEKKDLYSQIKIRNWEKK